MVRVCSMVASARRARSNSAIVSATVSTKPSVTSCTGDTLIRIGLDNGQNWKDLMRWNNLVNPNLIEVGQVIRSDGPATHQAKRGTPTMGGILIIGATSAIASAYDGVAHSTRALKSMMRPT